MTKQPDDKGVTQVPAYVVIITYIVCWGAGAFLIYTDNAGDWKRLVAAAGFILFPISGATPQELIRSWRK